LKGLPASIASLSKLEYLRISNNQISDLPDEIVHLEKLKDIDLSSNKFTTIPLVLGKMTSIERMNLRDNKWEGKCKEISLKPEEDILEHLRRAESGVPEEVDVSDLVERTKANLEKAIETAISICEKQFDKEIANQVNNQNLIMTTIQQQMQAAIQEAAQKDPASIGAVVAKYTALMSAPADTTELETNYSNKLAAIRDAHDKMLDLLQGLSEHRTPKDGKVEPVIEEIKKLCEPPLDLFADSFIQVFKKMKI